MTAQPFDPTLKALVEIEPADWPVLIGQPRAPTAVIDADLATVSGAADKALRVSAEPPYLLHLEFQSGHDSAQLPRKLHLRSCLLENRHHVLVRTAAVLLKPEADAPALTGVWDLAFPGEPPYDSFRYQVIRVWLMPPDLLLRGGLGTLPLAPISGVTEARLPGIIHEMERRLHGRREAPDIWSATYILLGLRYPPEQVRELLRGVRSMKESLTYQAILEEGKAEGKAEGTAEGALAEAKKMLRLQGESRFGPPDPQTAAALEAINDLARLEELGVRVLQVNGWQELLARRPPRRRRRSN